MFGSEVVEVGIGLSLLFFFMSLIATAFCEAAENVLKTRASYLEKGIAELLGRDNTELVRRFYEHPLIAALYEGDYAPGARNLPSYIPRQNFAVAALDILRPLNLVAPLTIESLLASLDTIEASNPVKKVILTIIDSAGNDLAKVRLSLEGWYDSAMDRVSGWFKRRSGFVLAGLGLFAAISLNVDAITIAKHLIADKALRAAVVDQAEQITAGGDDASKKKLEELKADFNGIGYPTGWVLDDGLPYPGPQANCTPVEITAVNDTAVKKTCGNWGLAVASAIPGWLITTLAVMLGAPFWFDVLNRLMVIRSTVKPTEKSPDETSQDGSGKARPEPPTDLVPAADQDVAADAGKPEDPPAEAMKRTYAEAAFVPMAWAEGDPQRGLA